MTYHQQGDTLYFKESIPTDAIEDMNEQHSKGIVQHGEHTGHKHQLHGDGFRFYKKQDKRYLRLLKPTPLKHEEHKEIMLQPGDYRIGIVREYDHFSEEAREVQD